jgi:hypothetical protein
MIEWKELKNQILAGTKEDSQGETNTKEFLLSLKASFNARGKIPLGQQHDMSKEAVGYINNFDVIPDKADESYWNLVGDVYFHDADIDSALRGFSYSTNIDIVGDLENKQVAVYVPFPYYNSKDLLGEIVEVSEGVSAGAWKKKNASPEYISLAISLALFVAAPAYTNLWNTKISPVLAKLKSKLGNSHSTDFIQVAKGSLDETYGIYFIPERGNEENCFTLKNIIAGIEMVNRHIADDDLAREKGVHIVKLKYSIQSQTFELIVVEYLDGSVINHKS